MLKKLVAFFSLFSSVSTLVCCALPALLVALGLGASLASFLGNYPQLIWLSEHKNLVFGFAGVMLLLTVVVRRTSATKSCPVVPGAAEVCREARDLSTIIFYVSVAIYLVGAFFAFVAPLLNQ